MPIVSKQAVTNYTWLSGRLQKCCHSWACDPKAGSLQTAFVYALNSPLKGFLLTAGLAGNVREGRAEATEGSAGGGAPAAANLETEAGGIDVETLLAHADARQKGWRAAVRADKRRRAGEAPRECVLWEDVLETLEGRATVTNAESCSNTEESLESARCMKLVDDRVDAEAFQRHEKELTDTASMTAALDFVAERLHCTHAALTRHLLAVRGFVYQRYTGERQRAATAAAEVAKRREDEKRWRGTAKTNRVNKRTELKRKAEEGDDEEATPELVALEGVLPVRGKAKVEAAVSWAEENTKALKSDGRLVLCGYSSGGHVAALYGLENCAAAKNGPGRFEAVVLVSGIYDLRTNWADARRFLAPVMNLIYKDILGADTEAKRAAASPAAVVQSSQQKALDGDCTWWILNARKELLGLPLLEDILFASRRLRLDLQKIAQRFLAFP
ncbi:unnamed protein product [Symbiodinium microadriaticum]|nr:unnamed protein product [Symbiodinium sp. KB8]CAE7693911.1 unnamed protein product [Symbiodinium microadriaticum]